MIRLFSYLILYVLFLFMFNCGGKKTPNPDKMSVEDLSGFDIQNLSLDTSDVIQNEKFYQLENSVEDIKREIEILHTRVMEYQYKPTETDYSKKLKEFIEKSPPLHKISLINGSIIKGTIKQYKDFSILVETDVGMLTINKSDLKKVEDLILPSADIIFIGNGKEEVFTSYRIFSGKIMNQGTRRGDFVRVVYYLWGENTNLILSDSTFVSGAQVIYKSGIITDTILEPEQSFKFEVQVSIPDSIDIAYITRDIRWELYD